MILFGYDVVWSGEENTARFILEGGEAGELWFKVIINSTVFLLFQLQHFCHYKSRILCKIHEGRIVGHRMLF